MKRMPARTLVLVMTCALSLPTTACSERDSGPPLVDRVLVLGELDDGGPDYLWLVDPENPWPATVIYDGYTQGGYGSDLEAVAWNEELGIALVSRNERSEDDLTINRLHLLDVTTGELTPTSAVFERAYEIVSLGADGFAVFAPDDSLGPWIQARVIDDDLEITALESLPPGARPGTDDPLPDPPLPEEVLAIGDGACRALQWGDSWVYTRGELCYELVLLTPGSEPQLLITSTVAQVHSIDTPLAVARVPAPSEP